MKIFLTAKNCINKLKIKIISNKNINKIKI